MEKLVYMSVNECDGLSRLSIQLDGGGAMVDFSPDDDVRVVAEKLGMLATLLRKGADKRAYDARKGYEVGDNLGPTIKCQLRDEDILESWCKNTCPDRGRRCV